LVRRSWPAAGAACYAAPRKRVLPRKGYPMRRREFVTFLGGAAAWPLAAHAQQLNETRRIGFLIGLPADDADGQARLAAFMQGLARLGWIVGHNLEFAYRAAGRDPDRYRKYAEELVALAPDVLLAGGASALAALQQTTSRLPIVFANATDPAGGGYLGRVARPARNTTGFLNFEPRFGWKFLELLKQLAPNVTRVAVLLGITSTAMGPMMEALRAVAPKFGVELIAFGDHDAGEIERGIATFVHGPNHGLIVASQLDRMGREQIIELAALYRLPAVYAFRRYIAEGGLISYGTDQVEPFRRAAGYVDRILKGERPVDLPVQAPMKYEIVINMKTATTLGLAVPDTIRLRVDEVIE
jgi:putative tryptophan/tyrosine transport system substrate-binding protein